MTTQSVGKRGEQLARTYLQQKGYRFLAANWRCKMGEIDLIMQDQTTRVMVEVRLRRPTSFGKGEDTVAWQKQRKLLNTAKLYQQKENYWGDLRFDVVSVESSEASTPRITHIEHAFQT